MNAMTRIAAICACLAIPGALAARIDMVDYCDPTDPAWNPTGGCLLEEGDVTFAEFNALASSVLSASVVGHPAWRMEPSYADFDAGEKLRVRNKGGRVHSFTEVAQFGGGVIPGLNIGLTFAPECASLVRVPPGQSIELQLAPGLHLFQCCIHPWMRAAVRVD
jgi:hypothetical protein